MRSILFLGLLFLVSRVGAQSPPVINSISGPTMICLTGNNTYTFVANASGSPSGFIWSISPSNNVTVNPSFIATQVIRFPNASENYTITCIAMDINGPSNPYSIIVNVELVPVMAFSGGYSFCRNSGSSTFLAASPTNNSASSTLMFSWAPITGLSGNTSLTVTAQPLTTTSYTLTASYGPLCNMTHVYNVVVLDCTGIQTYGAKENEMSVYPNPNSGVFQFKSITGSTPIQIFNDQGQLVSTVFSFTPEEKIVTNLKPGFYVARCGSQKCRFIVISQ